MGTHYYNKVLTTTNTCSLSKIVNTMVKTRSLSNSSVPFFQTDPLPLIATITLQHQIR